MNLPQDEVLYKKRVGKLGRKAVLGIGNIGGLHLIALQNEDGTLSTLGAGSHKGVARHIAKKYEPGIEFDILEKSEDTFQVADFQRFLPFWEQKTEELRNLQLLKSLMTLKDIVDQLNKCNQ